MHGELCDVGELTGSQVGKGKLLLGQDEEIVSLGNTGNRHNRCVYFEGAKRGHLLVAIRKGGDKAGVYVELVSEGDESEVYGSGHGSGLSAGLEYLCCLL